MLMTSMGKGTQPHGRTGRQCRTHLRVTPNMGLGSWGIRHQLTHRHWRWWRVTPGSLTFLLFQLALLMGRMYPQS